MVSYSITLSHLLKSYRQDLFSIAIFSSALNILALTGSLFMMQVYDRVLNSRSQETLWGLLIIVGIVYFFMIFFEYSRTAMIERIAFKNDQSLRPQVFKSILTYQSKSTITNSSIKDLDQVRSFMGSSIFISFFDLPWTIFYIVIIFFFHWALGVLTILGLSIIVILAIFNEILSKKKFYKAQYHLNTISQKQDDYISNSETIIALGLKNFAYFNINRHYELYQKNQKQGQDISNFLSASSKMFRQFFQSVILAVAAYFVIQGSLSAGSIIAVSVIAGRALMPIDQIMGRWKSLVLFRGSLKRLSNLQLVEVEQSNVLELPKPQGYLKLENVFFRSPYFKDKFILRNISLDFSPGTITAIIGPSGSGKSTLAKIICGIYKPSNGRVTLDLSEFDQYSHEQFGSYLGYIPQRVQLFGDTIQEAIARLDPNLDEKKIIKAAQLAQVHDLIISFPLGYNTPIDHYLTLSGGQMQRIALARALYSNPSLIVLDEPNSNLDFDGEQALLHSLSNLRKMGKTIILIEHRQSTLSIADKVVVLQSGSIHKVSKTQDLFKKNLNTNSSCDEK